MAFLKVDKKKSGNYLRIVESYREGGSSCRHKTLCHLGKAEDYSEKTLKKIGKIFLKLAGEEIHTDSILKQDMKELGRYNYGFPLIYDRIMRIYGLDKLFNSIAKKQKLTYNLYHSLLLMIIERLNEPSSKLSNYNHREEYIGLEDSGLHNLYRSLDQLQENQLQVQKQIYSTGRHLFNQELDIVFYDVTTFYFDSDNEDGFRQKGFNKDGKIGKTTIVFGMLIDKEKNPIGYRIYEGGKYEGHTFSDAVLQLKKEYSIDKVITVADRGMMNRENINLLNSPEIGYEFIIGERLKNLPKDLQEKILDRSKYIKKEIVDTDSGEIIPIEYHTIEYDGKRIITTYSESRSKKDSFERDEKIRKGKEYLSEPSKVERKASTFYLKKNTKSEYELDEEKIAKSQRYDGYMSISTNAGKLSDEEALDAYKQLYKIEHSFRTFKSYLEARPMFHWTRKRIEGHLCLCYISFTLLNYLIQIFRRQGKPISENKLWEIARKMELSLIEQSGEEFYLRSKLSEETKQLLNELKIKEIPNMVGRNGISNYISTT
jgi:transposase